MRKINSNSQELFLKKLEEKEIEIPKHHTISNQVGPTILSLFEYKLVPIMKFKGLRPRTIQDYRDEIIRFEKYTGVNQVIHLSKNSIIDYVSYGDVSQLTRNNRLKRMKAILNYMKKENLIQTNDWWSELRMKVDEKVKEGATQADIDAYLKVIDFNTYVGVRDALALLLMWETGLRVGTVTQLTESMIDFEANLIRFPGYTLKNGRNHVVPINSRVKSLLNIIIEENKILKAETGKETDYVFLTIEGNDCIGEGGKNSPLAKSISKRARKHGLDKIRAHNLRRGFANNLRAHGVDIATISKALGHQDLSTTTRYLYVDEDEQLRAINSVYSDNWYNQ